MVWGGPTRSFLPLPPEGEGRLLGIAAFATNDAASSATPTLNVVYAFSASGGAIRCSQADRYWGLPGTA
jgi:hypothetical protein